MERLCLLLALTTSQACSNFAMENDYQLSVRTMDLGNIPGLSWTMVSLPPTSSSKQAILGFAATLAGIVKDDWLFGGMNAAGLSCDAQTLIGTVYPREGHQDVVSLCRWALERFGSLKELELELQNATFKAPVLASLFWGLHWVLRDGHRGVVLEFVEGVLKVYEDLNDGQKGFGIMTNEPEYPWQVQAVKHLQWKESLSRSAVAMPGAWYPDERFQRIFLVKRGMPTPETYQEAVMQAAHVLNTVTVPMGLQLGTDSGKGSGEGGADHTQWGVIYDHKQRMIYWRHAMNQNLQRLELQKLFASGERRSVRVDVELPWFHDASDALQPQGYSV